MPWCKNGRITISPIYAYIWSTINQVTSSTTARYWRCFSASCRWSPLMFAKAFYAFSLSLSYSNNGCLHSFYVDARVEGRLKYVPTGLWTKYGRTTAGRTNRLKWNQKSKGPFAYLNKQLLPFYFLFKLLLKLLLLLSLYTVGKKRSMIAGQQQQQ